MQFNARIDGKKIRCTLLSDRNLSNPVFCYSVMAPSVSSDGYIRIKNVGGYSEIQLPEIEAGQEFDFTIIYENPDFAPANRAWLPLGSYLRCDGDIVPLPSVKPAGVQTDAIAYRQGKIPELLICPQPTSFTANGETISVRGIKSNSSELSRVNSLFDRAGLGPFLVDNGAVIECIIDKALSHEAYRLSISGDGITLAYSDGQGAFYGGITLATLIVTHKGYLPCGLIEDEPRFEWRGQHFDCARHFYKVDTILRLLDTMALLKMNRFHWHFADDEAFRLELESLPELSRTHFRGEGELVPGVFGGGARSGGSYSKSDAKLIVEHAKSLGIEVMPEIEVPAHALALCKLYPETRDRKENGAEISVQGYKQNAMNPAMPESWRIWEAMVNEVSEIFPFEVLHLGGDELPPDTWSGSPAASDLMRAEALETTQDLQGWTMNRLAKFTASKGKTPAGWEESALGSTSIANDAVIFSWTGQGPGLKAARDGHRVVMMPGQKTYLDMAQTDDQNDWGANWAAIISLEETLNWDPVPEDEPELEDKIIGIEGAFWSEFTTKDQEMEPMLAPRILGIATMGWQNRSKTDSDILLGLRPAYSELFRLMNWAVS
ncbi:MAG: beta-N-acetylhexosaminidase [Paracoccaceae bacterium]|nr:beta-N-acetylhexosaminidase [Paracoccaceae bacterium]MDG2257328.1 beta-N-acetylhexosaminidase [Paracoccaceae bacterium]